VVVIRFTNISDRPVEVTVEGDRLHVTPGDDKGIAPFETVILGEFALSELRIVNEATSDGKPDFLDCVYREDGPKKLLDLIFIKHNPILFERLASACIARGEGTPFVLSSACQPVLKFTDEEENA